jgi:predicted porin
MVRRVFCLALGFGLPALGLAQSTPGNPLNPLNRLYGSVDLAVTTTHTGAPGAGNTMSIASGVLRPSLFGFDGNEALGGGLAALFRLEAGFDADTRAAKTYYGNPATATPTAPLGTPSTGLFNRRATVGLGGAWGQLTAGRDYTPLYWAAMDSDAQGLKLYGNLQQSLALSGTGGENFGRTSNAVFYASPLGQGFMLRGMASMGSESGGSPSTPPRKANRMLAVSGTYALESWGLSAAYQQLSLPTVAGSPATFTGAIGTREDLLLGTRYTWGPYAISAGYLQIRKPTVANTDGRQISLGASAPMGPGTVLLSALQMRQNTASGTAQTAHVLGLGYTYPLSRRTVLYTAYGQVNNSATAAFPLVSNDTVTTAGALGAQVRAMAVGMQHTF